MSRFGFFILTKSSPVQRPSGHPRPAPPPMDYSKWDSMQCDDDDDDEKPRGPPRVTRLEGPARVTIGGTGAAAVSNPTPTLQPPARQAPAGKKGATDYSKWDSLGVSDDGDSDGDEDEDDEEDPYARAYMASRGRPPPPGEGKPAHAMPSQAPAPATAPPPGPGTGAAASGTSGAPQSHESLLAQLTRNGAQREAYLWRQTETEVELSVLVPAGTRAKQMLVEVRRPQSLATDERARVVVALRGSAAPLLDGELAYPVELGTGKQGGGDEGSEEEVTRTTPTLTLAPALTLTLAPTRGRASPCTRRA